MTIHPQGGSWCATVQMLITQATLANWQSSIHCSLCECVLSKSQACVSSLISWCGTRHRESPLTLFYSPQLTSPSFFFYVNGQSGGILIRCGAAVGDGAVAQWQGPIRTPSIIMSAFTGSSVCWTKRVLVYTYYSANLPGSGVSDPLQLVWITKQSYSSCSESSSIIKFIIGRLLDQFILTAEFWEMMKLVALYNSTESQYITLDYHQTRIRSITCILNMRLFIFPLFFSQSFTSVLIFLHALEKITAFFRPKSS